MLTLLPEKNLFPIEYHVVIHSVLHEYRNGNISEVSSDPCQSYLVRTYLVYLHEDKGVYINHPMLV